MSFTINQLTFTYHNQQPLIDDLTLTIPTGTITLMSGPTGCGKTTLLKLIAQLLPKYGGQIVHGSIHTTQFQRIAMLFQDPALQFTMDTARHELEFTLENLQVPHETITQRIEQVLKQTQLQNLADQPLKTLSGGQLQMVALAVTIAMNADLILLDEPFTNVDEESRIHLLSLLRSLQEQKHLTILIADHDLHGYQATVQQIIQFDHHHKAQLLSPSASQLLLKQADQQQTSPLQTQLPTAKTVSAYHLDQVQVARHEQLIIQQPVLMIPKNAVTIITGPSGSGKSTLFTTLCKQLPYTGQIQYQHAELSTIPTSKYFAHVGMLFQRTDDQFLNVTVQEELALSQKHSQSAFFTNERLHKIIQELQLQPLLNQVIYSLSGGQKKLLQNLVMLMMGKETLLMDEPFNGLDRTIRQKLIQLIQAIQSFSPQTMVIISHQPQQFRQLAQYHLVMNKRQLTYREG